MGACLGGSCNRAPLQLEAGSEPDERAPRAPRVRFARTGAVLGTVTAGASLAGALALALSDGGPHERVTRGLWLGNVALATPLVALSAWLARKGTDYKGYRGLRRLGWTCYGLAAVDGTFLWYGAFREFENPRALTLFAGVLGAAAILPHALDALLAARRRQASRLLGVRGSALRYHF